MSFDWIVEGRVAAMSMPWPGQVEALMRDGVRGLVSLTHRLPPGVPVDGLEHLHLPVTDFSPPTPRQLEAAVTFIDACLGAGHPVVVHCSAGLGRTGTVISAWLVSTGLTPDEAIRTVRARRPGSVETPAQVAAIAKFARSRGGGGF